MVPPRKPSYRSDMFDTSALTSIEAVENAAFEFQAIVTEGNIERILADVILHEPPAVVRLVLSCLDAELIMSRFPATPEAFSGSLAEKALAQLSLFFFFAHAQNVSTLHEGHQQLVKEAPKVLSVLASKLAMDRPESNRAPTNVKKAKAISQKQAKMARRVAGQEQNALDPAPFERLNIPVPETRGELEKAIEIILATQRSILKIYLESLRLPAVVASINAACLPAETSYPLQSDEASDSGAFDTGLNLQSNIESEPPTTYPTFQPIKFSTLYRKRATGFGLWDINIAPRAERDLREYNRRDRKIFFIIVKKMRNLSNGDFSADNQQQISGGNVEVPIYEAKVTEELRLVYQVDCVPRYDTKSEQQALKVFGIYHHAQLNRGSFWNSMSRELGKRGEEYKERCSRRQPSFNTQEFIPITFPAPEDARLRPGSVPDLPADDAEQIQSLLLKTVHFSQSLLDSILHDLDVAFVLEISPKELDIIEHPHSCYVLGRSGTGKTTTMLYKMLLVEASSEPSASPTSISRQLFVTQSRILADKVGEHFAKLLGGYRPSAVSENIKAAKKADRALVDIDEENDWRSDLPKKYSDLQDADFPLFVSFDQLCTMLEHDIEASGGTVQVVKPGVLTYKKFRREYWPHFQHSLCKGLEPSMVFSEFLGVIMGSEKALASKSYCLDRDVYLNLGERGQSTFADQREQIYELFEKYSSQKRRRGDTDAADRTHEILKFFQKHGVPGRRIDYLYVDETQDNLLIDTLLLRSLCQNSNGLFWAGDTAQTISVGSSFRFNELKAFLFRVEKQREKKHSELSFQPTAPPRPFQLTVNYRSHTGIVNCAHSVIEVITKLWPDAIDVLDPERGTVDGLRPIFFTNWDAENVQSKQFLFGDQPSGGYVELGAQQCILVRDSTAKEKLKAQVGEIGLIMTLYESKGLEFNDVLLYNFFEDSGVLEAQWRVVLNVMEHRDIDTTPAPMFDKMRHASVCTELKFLYVALTRARNNVWIADCSTKGEPMRMLWTSKDQVQNCILGTDTPRFAISSTPEEWREQGRKLFDRKRFSQAKLCYERAYMPHEAAVAQAYHLREEACEMPGNVRRELVARKTAYLNVALAFVACARNDRGDAAKIYFRRAGECFEHAGDVPQAIDAYSEARHFARVAELYRNLGNFDDAVATIQNHDQEINPDVAEKVIGVARLFYFKNRQIEKAGQLFEGPEEVLQYLEDRGLHVEHATLLESLGKFSDAAETHLKEGRTTKAIELFLNDHNTERASECILEGLWEKISFAVLPNTTDPVISHLLHSAAQVDVSLVSQSSRDEISMFQAIANREMFKLQLLGQSYSGNDAAVTLLCLDHRFARPPKTQVLPIDAVAKELQVFYTYVKLLHHFAFNVDPCASPIAEKLFGYRREGEDNYSIPQHTFIRRALPGDRSSEGTVILAGSDLRMIFQRSLRHRLAQKVREENAACRMTKAFEGPCLIFAIFNGQCNWANCPQEHLTSSFDSQEYNLRVRIHLQQILIYQSLHNINLDHSERRHWISRLYDVLNPPSYQLGSACSFNLSLIPEAEAGLQIVKEWVRSWSYELEFKPELSFLTHMVQLAHLAFQFDGKHAMSYLTHGPFMMDPRKPLMYRRPPDGQYVVAEFLAALDVQQDWALSAATLFLRHIITSRRCIHVNVLCDIAENLCAGLVVADRQRFGLFGLIHDITLPLSWLAKRCSTIGGLRGDRDTSTFWIFAQALSELLEPVYSGVAADHLLFENKSLGNSIVGFRIRDIVLARICRCLCLLAYNFRSHALRDSVLDSITSLRRRDPNRRFTTLCGKYVWAESWAALTRAVRSSTDGSSLDEMVQLLQASGSRPPAVPGVRQIVYEKIEDVPGLLGSSTPALTVPENPGSYGDQQTTPTVVQAETQEDVDDAGDEGNAGADERLPEDVAIDMPSVLEPIARSDEELAAAAKIRQFILRTHRRVEQRKRGTGRSNLLSELFAECRGQSVTMDRVHRLYRVHFLGPLPHLLLCLDIVHTQAQKEGKQIRKDLQVEAHEALENLDQKLTAVQRTLKQVIAIQKALRPTARIHAGRNLRELEGLAEQATTLLQALPFGAPPGLREHLNIAYKGIVQPRNTATRRAKPKPKLNTEEEMY